MSQVKLSVGIPMVRRLVGNPSGTHTTKGLCLAGIGRDGSCGL
jgi:hypothetical protein